MTYNRFLIALCLAVALLDIYMGFRYPGGWALLAAMLTFSAAIRIRRHE